MSPKTKRKITRIFILYIPLAIFVIFITIPLLWTLSLSFREEQKIVSGQFSILPNPFTTENYTYVWKTINLSKYFKNSLITSFGSVFIVGVLCLLNGYALSRCEFKFKRAFMIMILMTQMIPLVFNMTSIFKLIVSFGLADSLIGIILLHITSSLAYNTLMMKSFIGAIPKSVDEAALIDGCQRLQVLIKIILPSVFPGFITVIAYSFVTCWNEYLLSYTLLTSSNRFPLSVGLKYMIGEYSTNYAGLAAGCVIALLPPIIIFGYVQKHLVSGMSAGAEKG